MVPASKEQLQKDNSDLGSGNTAYDSFYIDEYKTLLHVKLEIREYDKNNTIIILNEISNYTLEESLSRERKEEITEQLKNLTLKDFEKHFKAHLTQKYGSARTLKSGLLTQ